MAGSLRQLRMVCQKLCRKSLSKRNEFDRSYYLYAPEPFHPLADIWPEINTAHEAVQVIQSGMLSVYY